LVAIAAVIGTLMITVSANDEDILAMEETETGIPPFRCGRKGWMSELTDDQKAELEAMREEVQVAIQAKLDEWGVEMEHGLLPNLTEDQRTELQTMMQEHKDAVRAKLEEWGVELPEFTGPNGWLSDLTEEQRAELQTMREEYRNNVQAKLDEWGVEAPIFENHAGFRDFGPMRGRYGGFGFRGFQMP
jgi:hypothetical protein